ncbi:hypothetical protein [Labrys wisconsinensis]|uniref:Uncharacterized protein n=1 Tax=Labrys wisconsinensis TaxID=425677 RepID=A0ABU0JEY2_9HYPH|nr:hypothetical protein [Labrys wisconsinensis]MDQ0472842.1 hypothetical protein [Labrys wisconsinensis]
MPIQHPPPTEREQPPDPDHGRRVRVIVLLEQALDLADEAGMREAREEIARALRVAHAELVGAERRSSATA